MRSDPPDNPDDSPVTPQPPGRAERQRAVHDRADDDRPSRSLLWRVFIALVAIHLVVGIALGWYAFHAVRDYHEQQTIVQLRRLMPILTARYVPLVDEERFDALDRMVKTDGAQVGVRITIVLADGRVVADSDDDPAAMDNHLDRPEVAEAMRRGTGSSRRFSRSVQRDLIYYGRQVVLADDETCFIRVSIPLAGVRDDLMQIVRVLALAGLVTMILLQGLLYLVARYMSSSVSRISEDAAELARADVPSHVAPPGFRELTPLAEALNRLSDQLHERIDELRTREHEHHAILQSMNSGVIAVDLQQRILSTNRAAENMLNLDGKAARGRLLQEAVRSPELHRYVTEALGHSGRLTRELNIRARTGRVLQASSGFMTDPRGTRVGILIVLNDVTELRRLESLRSDFAANVSHELRTPITNIKGYIETMLDVGVDDAAQTARFLEIIRRNSDRLAAIIEDILALAWLEQPDTRDVLHREPTKIVELVQNVVSQFENAAAAKSISIATDVPGDLEVEVNAQLIEQALANFVSNAIKYSPSETHITVTAARVDHRDVEIAVADQGPGIPREHLPRVFERFYRVDKARSRELGGTGLGLAIVKHIALVHGGRVHVDSAVGKGSTFRLRLPG